MIFKFYYKIYIFFIFNFNLKYYLFAFFSLVELYYLVLYLKNKIIKNHYILVFYFEKVNKLII